MHWDLSDHPGKVAGTINLYPGHGVAEASQAAAGGSPAPFTLRSHLPGRVQGIVDAISFHAEPGHPPPSLSTSQARLHGIGTFQPGPAASTVAGPFCFVGPLSRHWPALQQCGAGAFLESTMRSKFIRRRGGRAQAQYEPRTYADWREEQRLIAEQEAQRLQRQAATNPNPPPGGFVVSGEPKCNE